MNQLESEMFEYFASNIEKELMKLSQYEFDDIEKRLELETKGLGIEKQIAFLEEWKQKVKDREYPFISITKFSREEYKAAEFNTQERINSLKPEYEKESWAKEYILHRASFYQRAEIIEYLKNRSIEIQSQNRVTGKRKSRTPLLLWKEDPQNLLRLKKLRVLLIESGLIDKINLKTFKAHYLGEFPNELMNWRVDHHFIFYLFDKLDSFIKPVFYSGKGKTSSSTAIAAHFKFNGVLKDANGLYPTKSEGDENRNKEIKKTIDLIINKLN